MLNSDEGNFYLIEAFRLLSVLFQTMSNEYSLSTDIQIGKKKTFFPLPLILYKEVHSINNFPISISVLVQYLLLSISYNYSFDSLMQSRYFNTSLN